MDRQSGLKKPTGRLGNGLSELVQQSEVNQKTILITGYVEKFATIAGRGITPALYQIYVEALSNIEQRKLEKGLRRYLETGDRWPWPGTLAEYCEDEV